MFNGTATALITPFDKELNVDYSSLKKITEWQIRSGVQALVVLGTTGEAATIEDDERRKILETVVETAAGRIPVIAGTGTNNTMDVVRLNKIAAECSVDALLIVNPYYNKGTQHSLVEHYRYISERTDLPAILYNVPSRTGMNVLPETALRIHSECRNIVAMKEASGDISQIAKLMAMKPDSLVVYSGNDDQTLPVMSLGGAGVISVFSNIFPSEMVEITNAVLENNWQKARELNNRFLKFMNLLFIEANPSPVKAAAEIIGLCSNTLRLPLSPVMDSSYMLLKEEINLLRHS